MPFPPLGDLPNPGIEPASPTLQADFFTAEPEWLGLCIFTAKGPGSIPVGNKDSVSHMAQSKKKRKIHLKHKIVPHYTSKVDFDTTSSKYI